MAYDIIKIWDGSNRASVDPNNSGLKIRTPISTINGSTVINVGLTAVLLGITNLARTTISFYNKGTSSIVLGTDSIRYG